MLEMYIVYVVQPDKHHHADVEFLYAGFDMNEAERTRDDAWQDDGREYVIQTTKVSLPSSAHVIMCDTVYDTSHPIAIVLTEAQADEAVTRLEACAPMLNHPTHFITGASYEHEYISLFTDVDALVHRLSLGSAE